MTGKAFAVSSKTLGLIMVALTPGVGASCQQIDTCSSEFSLGNCPAPFHVFVEPVEDVFARGVWHLSIEVDGAVAEDSCDLTASGASCSVSGDGFGLSFAADQVQITARNVAVAEDRLAQILPERVAIVFTPPGEPPVGYDWNFEPDYPDGRGCGNCQRHREEAVSFAEFSRVNDEP